MKSILLSSLLLLSISAMAADNVPVPAVKPGATQQAQQQKQSQQTQQTSTSEASNQGNNQAIVLNMPGAPEVSRTIVESSQTVTGRQEIVQSGTSTLRNVPSVSGPPLVSSNDTCMGSTSGSVNVPGFGATVGSTWTDQNCKMLKNSRELWNMGMKAAALARMCMDDENLDALEMTGFECPQTTRARARGQEAAKRPEHTQYTDPIVRQRLGLPPLK